MRKSPFCSMNRWVNISIGINAPVLGSFSWLIVKRFRFHMMRLEVRTLPPKNDVTADLRIRTNTRMKDLRKRRRWTRLLADQ